MVKKIITILLVIIVGLGFLLQIDDELSEESKGLINRLEQTPLSEAYLFLLGINANKDQDPIQVGRELLAEIRKSELDESYEIEYFQGLKVERPEPFFCQFSRPECLSGIFATKLDSNAFLEGYSTLIERTDRFLNYTEYTTLTQPSINEYIPPFELLFVAQRLMIIKAISLHQKGDSTSAMNLLSNNLSRVRQSMALQDNLIGKLVLLNTAADLVEVMSVIASQTSLDVAGIPKLTAQERSFHIIAAREFGLPYHYFKSLDRSPDLFQKEGNVPGWVTRIFFKPNMSINALTPIYLQMEQLSKMTAPEFAESIRTSPSHDTSTSKFRNYMGDNLNISNPDFRPYIARTFDFDIRVAIFNQRHVLKRPLEKMKNPYFGNETPKQVDGKLCFDGPMKDEKLFRCLTVNL